MIAHLLGYWLLVMLLVTDDSPSARLLVMLLVTDDSPSARLLVTGNVVGY